MRRRLDTTDELSLCCDDAGGATKMPEKALGARATDPTLITLAPLLTASGRLVPLLGGRGFSGVDAAGAPEDG